MDITRARQQVARSNEPVRTIQSRNQRTREGRNGATAPNRNPPPALSSVEQPSRELFKEAFDKVGPRNADSMPLPLLILGGLALLLITAGAAGLVSRHLRARKLPA